MKKYTLSILVSTFLLSCGGSETTETIDEDNESVMDASFQYPEGAEVYQKTCIACHQASGEGIPGTFPPLAKSDYLLEDSDRAIEQIIMGSFGEMTVNGKVYNGIMPPQGLNNEEVRDVMNYILNSWGNVGGEVTTEQVSKVKRP